MNFQNYENQSWRMDFLKFALCFLPSHWGEGGPLAVDEGNEVWTEQNMAIVGAFEHKELFDDDEFYDMEPLETYLTRFVKEHLEDF